MKHFWLNKADNQKLIIFFAGWSMDEAPFLQLKSTNHDVLMFFDYSELNVDETLLNECNSYSEINIIAWSMGIWAAGFLFDKFKNAKHSIAVNGTLLPEHDEFGIPKNIFQGTIDNFTPENRPKFYKRMFSSRNDFEKFLEVQPRRSVESQKNELIQLQTLVRNSDISDLSCFGGAIVGKADKIIPAKNQLRFWEGQLTPTIIDSGHFPFFMWESWEEVLSHA